MMVHNFETQEHIVYIQPHDDQHLGYINNLIRRKKTIQQNHICIFRTFKKMKTVFLPHQRRWGWGGELGGALPPTNSFAV